jgi:hypothetical protein
MEWSAIKLERVAAAVAVAVLVMLNVIQVTGIDFCIPVVPVPELTEVP